MSLGIRTLVLNNQFMPLSVFPLYTIPAEDALVRSLNGTCSILASYERPVLTPSRSDLYWPSVIVNHNAKGFQDEVRLKRETLLYRDWHCCIFCEEPLTLNTITIDHIVPRSKGGKHKWENVGAACKHCNEAKGNHMPVGRWKPKREPYKPSFFQMLEIRKKFPLVVFDEAWTQFLPNWSGPVTVKTSHGFLCEAA